MLWCIGFLKCIIYPNSSLGVDGKRSHKTEPKKRAGISENTYDRVKLLKRLKQLKQCAYMRFANWMYRKSIRSNNSNGWFAILKYKYIDEFRRGLISIYNISFWGSPCDLFISSEDILLMLDGNNSVLQRNYADDGQVICVQGLRLSRRQNVWVGLKC